MNLGKIYHRNLNVTIEKTAKKNQELSKSQAFDKIIKGAADFFKEDKTGKDFVVQCLELRGGTLTPNEDNPYENLICQLGKNKNNYWFTGTEVFPRGFQKTLAIGYIRDNANNPANMAFINKNFNFNGFKEWIDQNFGSEYPGIADYLNEKYYAHIKIDKNLKIKFGNTEYVNEVSLTKLAGSIGENKRQDKPANAAKERIFHGSCGNANGFRLHTKVSKATISTTSFSTKSKIVIDQDFIKQELNKANENIVEAYNKSGNEGGLAESPMKYDLKNQLVIKKIKQDIDRLGQFSDSQKDEIKDSFKRLSVNGTMEWEDVARVFLSYQGCTIQYAYIVDKFSRSQVSSHNQQIDIGKVVQFDNEFKSSKLEIIVESDQKRKATLERSFTLVVGNNKKPVGKVTFKGEYDIMCEDDGEVSIKLISHVIKDYQHYHN